MDRSILRISSKSKNVIGTGFVVDRDNEGVFVATCGHVVNDCGEKVLVEGKESSLIKNNYSDGLDLAILYVLGLSNEPLPILENKTAEVAKVIGYSTLLDDPKRESINEVPVKTNVQITKTPSFKLDSIKLYPGEPISRGYSGSPVICNKTNKVIGIVNIQVGDDTNYAICAKHLIDIYDVKHIGENNSFPSISTKKPLTTEVSHDDYIIIKKKFEDNLEMALKSFSTQQKVWIEPTLHSKEEGANPKNDKHTNVNLSDIVDKPRSIVVSARQQFGLTCLAHHLVKEAWLRDKPSFWLYLDANDLKPHKSDIKKRIAKNLKKASLSIEDIECIVLDEFSSTIKDASKVLSELSDYCADIPTIVMMTILDNPMLNESADLPAEREFELLHLWALPRHDVRQVVNVCNSEKYVGDENTVVSKVISDLEVLNIPRTPLNCLTILKIYEAEFDDSPVNRTEMIGRVLFLLFNVDEIPHYKSRPDLKDTEYILGHFCEKLIKTNAYYFSREGFLEELNMFCASNEIDIETHVIFDVLYTNNIIVMRGQQFCFKFSYWVFYFAAHRMHHDPDFADFILKDMNYASYPELIEFYTGIDRRRDNALKVLADDIRRTRAVVEGKCGLPTEFNLYDLATWNPSENQIEDMQDEIATGALNSNLPDIVKDQYADKQYNRARPLNQSIHKILESYSLLRLMRSAEAGSRALRNSDYSSPTIRHKLLKEILSSWEQIIKVLIVLSPVMAIDGYANLEGASFILTDDIEGSPEEKFYKIIQVLPKNVVDWYRDDLFSKKMGPLFYKYIENEDNNLINHTLNILMINKRPKGWAEHIEKYIYSEHKNSFYLSDIYHTLRLEYEFGFVSRSTLTTIGRLIKMTAAKHQLGIDKPGKKVINKKTLDGHLPDRVSDIG